MAAPSGTTVKWMWTDAGLGYQIEKLNPFRWSSAKSIKETVKELQASSDADKARPVAVRIFDRCTKEEFFSNVSSAIEGILKVVVFTDAEGDCNTIMQRVSGIGLCWSVPGLGKRDIPQLTITLHGGSCFGVSGPFGLAKIADPAAGEAQKELIRRLLEIAVLNYIPVEGEGLGEFSEVIVTNKVGKRVTVPIVDKKLKPYDVDGLETVVFEDLSNTENKIAIRDEKLIWTYEGDAKPVSVLRVELYQPGRGESKTSEGQFEIIGPFSKSVIKEPPGPKQKPLMSKLLTMAEKCGVYLTVGNLAANAVGRPAGKLDAKADPNRGELEFAMMSMKPGFDEALQASGHPAKAWIEKAKAAQAKNNVREAADCWHRAQLEIYDEVQKIKSAFLHFDRDGDGIISMGELSAALAYLGLLAADAADADLKKLSEEMDKNNDSKITYDELELWAIKNGGMKKLFEKRGKDCRDPDEKQQLALMETGINAECLSFWSPTLPKSELQAIVELKPEQRHAVAHTRAVSKYYHSRAWTKLLQRVKKLHLQEKDVFTALDYIREQAPLVVHLQLDKQIGDEKLIDKLIKDTHYRNQFETGVSGGYLGKSVRQVWEHDLFGDAYDKAQGGDRPKYGVLNTTNDPRGCASCHQYGDSYLLLKDMRLRTTFSSQDSANLKAEELACCDYYAHVLNEYSDKELGISVLVGSGKVESYPSGDIRSYKEAQYHGMVLLKQHVVKLVAHERLRKDEALKAKIEACCKEHNFQLSWMDELEDERKRKNNKKAHILATGDPVVARYPKYRGKPDNPWFAGTVKAIDVNAMRCTIHYEDGDISADVQENEVLFAPSRDPQWGKGCMRGSDLKPRDTSPVLFKPHALAVGDLVVAKFVKRSYDKNWYAGVVTKIDMEKKCCSIKYHKEKDDAEPLDNVKVDDVLYAPSREPEWGTKHLQGADLVPLGAAPVVLAAPADVSKPEETPKDVVMEPNGKRAAEAAAEPQAKHAKTGE